MKERLYFKDPYLKEFEGTVADVMALEGCCAVELDNTAFYPEGGGQGADSGTIVFSDGQTFTVTDVQEKEGRIWHVLSCDPDRPVPENIIGSRVFCRIDWERRFDHMQQHSGEHIVSGMICSRFHCNNVGFHMGEDLVTVDFDTRIRFEEALEIEAAANRYIWEDHRVVESWPSERELEELEYRSKKELSGEVRIISFPGADACACCGIHVSGSAQVGLVKFISAQNFHEGTRLELLCGKRAAEYLAMTFLQAKKAAVMLSTGEDKLAERLSRVLEENIQWKTQAARTCEKLFRMRAEECRGLGNVLIMEEGLNPVQTRELADLVAGECGGTAAVFSGDHDRFHYAVINPKGLESDFIRNLNAALNGKGGGRNGFAQGSVNAKESEIRNYFESFYQL